MPEETVCVIQNFTVLFSFSHPYILNCKFTILPLTLSCFLRRSLLFLSLPFTSLFPRSFSSRNGITPMIYSAHRTSSFLVLTRVGPKDLSKLPLSLPTAASVGCRGGKLGRSFCSLQCQQRNPFLCALLE